MKITNIIFITLTSFIAASSLSAREVSLGSFRCVGKNFTNARLVSKNDQEAVIAHDNGISKVNLLALPQTIQKRVNFYPEDYCVDSHHDKIEQEQNESDRRARYAEQDIYEMRKRELEADLAMQSSMARTEALQREDSKNFGLGILQPKDINRYRLINYYKSRQARLGNINKSKTKKK
jgi:hypothetical protein